MAFIEFMYFNCDKTRYLVRRNGLPFVIEQTDTIELTVQCIYIVHKFQKEFGIEQRIVFQHYDGMIEFDTFLP